MRRRRLASITISDASVGSSKSIFRWLDGFLNAPSFTRPFQTGPEGTPPGCSSNSWVQVNVDPFPQPRSCDGPARPHRPGVQPPGVPPRYAPGRGRERPPSEPSWKASVGHRWAHPVILRPHCGTLPRSPRSRKPRLSRAFGQWAVLGSNQRPPPCRGGALPAELTARGAENSARIRSGNAQASAPEHRKQALDRVIGLPRVGGRALRGPTLVGAAVLRWVGGRPPGHPWAGLVRRSSARHLRLLQQSGQPFACPARVGG